MTVDKNEMLLFIKHFAGYVDYVLQGIIVLLVSFIKITLLLSTQIISAISGGITDLTFDTLGYGWQVTNCVLTASYSVSSFSFKTPFCGGFFCPLQQL